MLFVVLLGFVSLFADMTYEGARSITGPYLAYFGASGALVGFVAGFGEFIGYSFRMVSGYLADTTRKYWAITFFGYALNLLAVPLLALAGNWQVAAGLILLERFGKAIRSPAKDAMLSFATKKMGRGFGFGLHEAMDQTGAILGPLIVSVVLYFKGSYKEGFALLLIPALLALLVLLAAFFLYPKPEELESKTPHFTTKNLSSNFWHLCFGVSLVAFGFIDFSLVAYHFEKESVMPAVWIPLLFSISMGVAGVSSLIFGKLYDTFGIVILSFTTLIASFFVPLVFLEGFYSALLGMILWGVGIGSQETIIKAFVAEVCSVGKRATGYGTLNMFFGLFWFLGSALTGYLYDISRPGLIACSLLAQWAAIPFLLSLKR